jgi:ABC-type lipoprotein export system ATPase subunit
VAVRSLYVEPAESGHEIRWGALECHDVFKIYRSGPVETVALRGLDLRIEPGESVAILGPSGCGKSTLLALAAGLDEPSAGELRVWGRSLGRLEEAELAAYRARDLAIVFQSDNLWPALSAQENVAISLRLAGHDDAESAAARSLAAFGLDERRSHRAAALSGGEQQRVAIAAAAARRARLVLADEPTGELDQRNEEIVLEALEKLRREYDSTVVLVTHSERVAERAQRVIGMRDGRVAA